MEQSQQMNYKGKNIRKYQREYKAENKTKYEESNKNHLLIPIIFVLEIIPLITRMFFYDPKMSNFPWFPNITKQFDLFLYYKHWLIIITAALMVIIIFIKGYTNHKSIQIKPIFIPLIIYLVFVIISTILSKYISYSINGSFEEFESVFVLISYCMISFYSFLVVKTEKSFKDIIYFLIIASIIMSIIGLTQISGHDLLTSKFGSQIIVPAKYGISNLNLSFNKNQTFLTLYNPDYVGVYAALIVPILIVAMLYIRDLKLIILGVLGSLGLIISLIGSKSLTGFLCLIISFLSVLLLSWKKLIKKPYITIPIMISFVLLIFIINLITNNYLWNKVTNTLAYHKTNYNITSMDTNDNNISITYKGQRIYVEYINNNQKADIILYDDNSQLIQSSYDKNTNSIVIYDERFQGITIGSSSNSGVFYINIDGVKYNFTNMLGDGSYYYLNELTGKFDKMITAPSAIFDGYETFASGRGYIWSRTIPMLKNFLFIGSGPDTYTFVFPQNDYINMRNSGFSGSILTKPHSLYLQIAVQTGVISLLAFLIFYIMYFISSIRLYMNKNIDTLYSKVGIAIFIGTISYMIAGITNDSSVTTAPLFWCLVGVGIAANQKVKSMILVDKVLSEHKI